jgi:serine protease Do
MRRLSVTVLAVGVLAAAAVVFATSVAAQNRGRARAVRQDLTLQGLGSAIGISVRDLSAEEASKGVASEGGAVVDTVREGSPAARAGFRSGDIVVDFDGERVRSARVLTRIVRETRPGRAVKATVIREGGRVTLDVTPEARTMRDVTEVFPDLSDRIERSLRALPRNFSFDFDFDLPDDRVQILRRTNLGATLTSLTPQLAEYFGVREGVLVTTVADDSRAAQAGLRAGDVITSVGGNAVRSAGDVSQALRRATPGANLEMRVMRDKKEMTLQVPAPAAPTREPVALRRGVRV